MALINVKRLSKPKLLLLAVVLVSSWCAVLAGSSLMVIREVDERSIDASGQVNDAQRFGWLMLLMVIVNLFFFATKFSLLVREAVMESASAMTPRY